uniref:CD8 alpha chain n=1 Tax=Dicentrarchus labrax TaxID=13489 RepID=Q3MSN7_DICLA|nr:CD8 alpha chain [Dicentrarchus labrax]
MIHLIQQRRRLQITSGAGEDKATTEGQLVEIHCQSGTGTMIIWFRVLDKTGMEFIGSFSNNGVLKSTSLSNIYRQTKINQNILILQSFNKSRDSGIYSCASLYKGNELRFGKITRLFGEKAKVPQGAQVPTIKPTLCTTAATTPCVCNKKEEQTNPDMYCPPLILGPLAGGCGLLLLLLIITTLYCNKIRTRRCPHHYKRKPRTMAPGKQMMTHRHV